MRKRWLREKEEKITKRRRRRSSAGRSASERGISLVCAAAVLLGAAAVHPAIPEVFASDALLLPGTEEQADDGIGDGILDEALADEELMIEETGAVPGNTSVSQSEPSAVLGTANTLAVEDGGLVIEDITVVETPAETAEYYSAPVSTDETENEQIWQESVKNAVLTGDYAADLIAVAQTQLGVSENRDNFRADENGITQYYSRYGQWYGDTYEEWSAMFVSFCIFRAEIPQQYLPREKDNSRWAEALRSLDLYREAGSYSPQAGDLIFFDKNLHGGDDARLQEGSPAHVGIVTGTDGQFLYTIEGNSEGAVRAWKYSAGESGIAGFMSMAAVMEDAGKTVPETEYPTETETGTEYQTETETETGTEYQTETETETGTEYQTETETETGTEYQTETETEYQTETETETGTEYQTETETETGTEYQTETETETGTEYQTETETETGTEYQTETETETETEYQTETETETGTEYQTETETETGTVYQTIVIRSDDVILRAEPSIEAEKIAVVDAGTELALLDTVQPENDEYSWYKVLYYGETGETPVTAETETNAETNTEINTETEQKAEGVTAYVRSDLADLKTEETETESETETEDERRVIEIPADGVILRAEASTQSELLAVLAAGMWLEVTEETEQADGLWYQVAFTGELEEAIRESGVPQPEPEAEIIPDGLTETEMAETLAEEQKEAPETLPAEPAEQTEAAQAETPETETEPGETVPEELGEETVPQTEPEGIPAYVKADFTDLYVDEPETLVWEDEDVVITISETVVGAFPENAGLQIQPIREEEPEEAVTAAEAEEIESVNQQYAEVEAQLEAAVEEASDNPEEPYQIVDFLAYDITFRNAEGEEVQPLAPLNVTFERKKPVLTPEKAGETEAETETETTESGEQVIDLTAAREEEASQAVVDATKVFHVDPEAGSSEDMQAEVSADAQTVAIETTHFSIYVVVDLEQLGGQIDLTVQHWATVNQLDGVDGIDGLIESAGPNGTPGDATAALRSKDVFTNIYTDDVIKLDNKLNKNVEELSKVLLADANSAIKNYELKEIWVLMDNQTPGTSTIDKTDTNAYNTEKSKWTVYSLDDTDKTVKLTKKSIIRMIYEPVEANNAFSQNVTFYDYDVTDGKRYNANGQEDPNGNYLNTTNKGINSDENYNGGDTSNRLAVGMNSTWVDHKYHNARSNNGVVLNWAGTGQADDAKKGIVTGISADGPIYNGVVAPQLFNNTAQIGKTVINGYQLHFSQVGDTYTLSSVTNASGSTVLSDLETIREIWDKPGKNRHIFSNNFWPLDGERHDNQDPLLGGSTSFNSFNTNKVTQNEGNSKSTGESDDGKDHNWLFGMRYSFEFTLGDYTGPLNFYFRGDDDFWLFVDGKLQTDLGGIHSSVGANLDLTKCINTSDRDKTHKIEIIYAERGCFGSTCYMQFTLPNVKPVEFDTETPKTSVTVNKVWQDHNNPNRPASIDVELYYRAAGSNDAWKKYDTKTLSAANNWTYTWTNMPKEGYEYKVHEVGEEGGKFGNYITAYSEEGGLLTKNPDETFSGTITNSGSPSTYITVNKAWDDGNNANNSRPDSVDFYLYYRKAGDTKWTQYPNGKLTLRAAENWTGKYENLPVYWGDTEEKMEYTVMEINGNDPLSNGAKLPGKTSGFEYTVSYPDGYIENDFGKGYVAKTDNTETPQETLNLTVTNSLGVSIKVNKVWKGRDPENGTVIYVGLYQAGQSVADKWVELNADNNWTATFQYLTPASDYSVKELKPAEGGNGEFNVTVGDGTTAPYVGVAEGEHTQIGEYEYIVDYGELIKDSSDASLSTVTITNQAQWQLIKYSSSKPDKTLPLKDAEFELKHSDGTTYKGVSDANGIVKWTKDGADFTGVFPDGNYTLTETVAPIGYALGDPVIFEMKDGVPVKMNDKNADIKDGILTFYYANEILYTLPSTGGPGIHWYIIGGMLLMMAAVLMVYKQKRGEVLERK